MWFVPRARRRGAGKSKCRPSGGGNGTIYISSKAVNETPELCRRSRKTAFPESFRPENDPPASANAGRFKKNQNPAPLSWGKPKKRISMIPLTLVTESGGLYVVCM